jgi:signal transduction histidine kinase
MRRTLQILSSGCLLPAITVVLLELAAANVAQAAEQKQVLVLYSTRRDAQIVKLGEQELPRTLEEGHDADLDYYSEYLDQTRFPDQPHETAFRDFLRVKYSGLRFDVVIAIEDPAVEFLTRNRDELFPGTPVVFFTNSPVVSRMSNATGIVATLNFAGTIDLAVALQPDLRRVFVVAGVASGDQEYEKIARAQFKPYESRFTFTYLSGMTTKELEARLAALPDQSIVYYLLVDRDGAGERFHPLEYLDRVTAVAGAPTYCWVNSAIGHGIVGGSLKDQRLEVDAIGVLARRILQGEAADSIPVSSPQLNVRQVDWRQLRRWNLGEARVPAGTVVSFRNLSVWERYKFTILGAVALVAGQTLLIAGLLVQRRRRWQAEQMVRGSQAALRASYEQIRDLGGRLLSAQDEERARIARELHDDISQQMALLTIDLELLGGAVQGPASEMAGEVMSRAHGIARSVHDLSHRLHPARLRLIGLVAALQGLQRELSSSDITMTFTQENVPPTLPPDLTLCLFRIAQEALQNVLKHGKARTVNVRLQGDADAVRLTITDDGVGFEVVPALGKGLGLVSMSERLDVIGGALTLHSRPGAGTRLEAVAPLHAAPPATSIGPEPARAGLADSA